MKKFGLLIISISVAFGANSLPNLYDIKEAKVDYKISGGGNMMGMGEIKVTGKKRVVFKDYGRVYLEEKLEVRSENVMGQSNVSKTHMLTYRNGAVHYNVDFKRKRIDRMVNQMASLAYAYGNSKNTQQEIEKNLKAFGAKKVGKDKVLDKSCDIWQIMGAKICLYKGLSLKIESNIMGIKQSEVATKITFNVQTSDFKLPNFPVYSGSLESLMNGVPPRKIDKSKLKQMDIEDNKKIAKLGEGAKEFGKVADVGLEGAKKAGYDPTSGKDLSPEQERAMQKAMMNAMNNKGMLEQIKAQMLEKADITALKGLKRCYKKTKTLDDANKCKDKYKEVFDNMDHFKSWSDTKKKKFIKELDDYIKAIPCIKSAKSMDALEECMPN